MGQDRSVGLTLEAFERTNLRTLICVLRIARCPLDHRYFPLFIFGHGADADSMVSMPMSAPAAVPDEEGESEEVEPTDACEMMLCTTKQKKRKGVCSTR